jgi:hypothetical protein
MADPVQIQNQPTQAQPAQAQPSPVPEGVTFGDPGQNPGQNQAPNSTPNNTQLQPNQVPEGVTFGDSGQGGQGQEKEDLAKHGILSRAYDWANSSLPDKVLPKDMKIADLVKAAAFTTVYHQHYIPGINDFDTKAKEHFGEGQPSKDAVNAFIAGAAKDIGAGASGMTSPLQLGLMATGAGEAGVLGKTAATVAKPLAAVAGTGLTAAGVSQTYQAVKDAIKNGFTPENVQQGLSGAALAAGGAAGAGKGLQGAEDVALAKLRPSTETVGNTEVPVRNTSLPAKFAQRLVPAETLEQMAREQTGPAVAKGIGETAKEAAGTEGEVNPDQHDRFGLRGVANEVKQRSQDTFKKLDEVSGNMLSEAQQMAQDSSGDYSTEGRKNYRQAMDLQDAIFNNYKGHSELQGMDLDQAKNDWRQQTALREINKKLSSATEASEGSGDYQIKQGKQLGEAVDSLVKNDKDVLERANMSDDHIDQLQKFGKIVREQANVPRFNKFLQGAAKTLTLGAGWHEGGFAGALGASAAESAVESAGSWMANKLLGKVLTTPSALETLNNGLTKGINPTTLTESLKSDINKEDPTWAEKMGSTLSNLWHDESGELRLPQAPPKGPQTTYENDPTGGLGNMQHAVRTTANGKLIGELAAQDTAPGVVTVRSNQVYDPEFRGKGYGKSHLMHLFKNASDQGAKAVNSDISTTGAAQNVWNSLEKRFPDAVTKKVYADGRPQWTVNLKALKDRLDFEGSDYTNTERRAQERKAPMSATELEDAMKNRKAIQTPFDTTAGAMQTINNDKAMPAFPGK